MHIFNFKIEISNLNRVAIFFFFTMAQQPLVGQGLFIVEGSRSHSDTPHSVELLWTNDQPDAATSTLHTQYSQETNIHAPARFESAIPGSERPQTHALDRAATGIDRVVINPPFCVLWFRPDMAILYYYYYYYYYLLQLSFHSVAVILILVTNKNKYT
jgi:hypothetical protein